jgi:hypothetical protein
MPLTCDFCAEPALYDAKTQMGPWANLCEVHKNKYAVQREGLCNALNVVKNANPSPQQPPTMEELEEMVYDGIATATDGCEVEPDGTCEHGKPSWLLQMGLI